MLLMFHSLLSLQSGSFDLVGTIVYEIDQHPYQSIFYNGTIEVVEAGGFLSVESVFLFTLGIALVGLLFSWIYGQMQNLSKVSNSVPSVHGWVLSFFLLKARLLIIANGKKLWNILQWTPKIYLCLVSFSGWTLLYYYCCDWNRTKLLRLHELKF